MSVLPTISALLLLTVSSSLTGCSGSPAQSRLAVVIAADTAGWIVPCGCTSNQSGGLSRRGGYVRELEKDFTVLVADVGGAPAGTSEYDRMKFSAILSGEQEMGVVAHNLGAAELALGPAELLQISKTSEIQFVSANTFDDQGKRLAPPTVLVERAGRRILLVGVVSPKFAVKDVSIRDPRAAVLESLATHTTDEIDTVIVLAYLPADELRALAAALPEVDLIVGGPVRQSMKPEQIGPVLVSAVTNKGKFIAQFTAPQEPGSRWQGQIVEMTDKYPNDDRQQAVLQAFRKELTERDLPADQTGFSATLPTDIPASYQLAGTAKCQTCHADDCQSWEASTHSSAWETLVEQNAHVDAYCQQCHTTGFGLPGGFVSANRSEMMTNVGCESCHGPSQPHVNQPELKTPFAAADQCLRCHDRENSPEFAYQSYWDQIVHGTTAAPKADDVGQENSP